MGASPGSAIDITKAIFETDITHILPAVACPTLVVHRSGDELIKVEEGRFIAERIRGARMVELPGSDHLLYAGDMGATVDVIEDFFRQTHHGDGPPATLVTVVAVRHGNGAAVHLKLAQARHGGRVLSVRDRSERFAFDGPTRALRFAFDVLKHVDQGGAVGISIGECEVVGQDLDGEAAYLSIELLSRAGSGEVLVTNTVRDLVAGSGFRFLPHGEIRSKRGAIAVLKAVKP